MVARRQVVAALALALAASGAHAATVIANWTFESTQPISAGPFAAEIGTGTALGHHATSSTYSSPAGNGSAHSFSSTAWSVGDYYQFNVSTLGLSGLSISWDQTSSNTGPKDFALQYSTDGTTFTNFRAYSVLANGTPNPAWNGTTASAAYSFSSDLSALSGLDNQTNLFFRLVDQDTAAANGGTVASGGTDRVDNVKISALSAVPLPAAVWLLGSGLLGLFGMRRRLGV